MIAIAGFHDRQRVAGAGFIRHVHFLAAGVKREIHAVIQQLAMILCVVDQVLMPDDDLIRIDPFRQQRFDRFHGGRAAGVRRYRRPGQPGSDAGSLQNLLFLPLEAFRGRGDLSDDPNEYMDTLQKDIFEANVYVMTPKGRVIELPNGSTPIDFAYRVHTEVGHSTVGAMVNETLVPLNTPLKTGDVVQIKTSKQSAGPSEDWLKFVKTNHAKNKIRGFLQKKEVEKKQEFIERGEQIIRDELKKRGYPEKDYFERKKIESILTAFQVGSYTDLMYGIAVKSISVISVIEKLTNQKKPIILDNETVSRSFSPARKAPSKSGIIVPGIESMMISLAGCCSPIPGDEIVGYISKGNGVKVHRRDCPNVANEKSRLIDVEWDDRREPRKYEATIQIYSHDRNFLLTDLMTVISQCKASLQNINSSVNQEELTVSTKIMLLVDDYDHLKTLIANLKKVNSVVSVERVIQ